MKRTPHIDALMGTLLLFVSVAHALGQGVTVGTRPEKQATDARRDADVLALQNDIASIRKALAAIEARLSKLEQQPTPQPTPARSPQPPAPAQKPTGKLLQKADLAYKGAYLAPQPPANAGDNWRNFSFKGALGASYDAATESLFLGGHEVTFRIGQIKIPEIRNTAESGLARATAIQWPQSIIPKFTANKFPTQAWIFGSLPVGDKLLVGCAENYGDRGFGSHGVVAGKNLSAGPFSGFYHIADVDAGAIGGYMCTVPPEWQARLGTKYLTGLAGVNVTARSSSGPAAWTLDPDKLNTVHAKPLLFYPLPSGGSDPNTDHPLAPQNTTNPLWNTVSEVRGACFPEGTDSVLFFGMHGTGTYWYGQNGDGSGHNDPVNDAKGAHAYPYHYYVWAYNAADLQKVKEGELKPWEPRPYAVWQLDPPFVHDKHLIGGAGWNAAKRELHLPMKNAASDGDPVINVYRAR
jgi:hypothetical protein